MCEQVKRMADTLTHRGPDDAGVWVDPSVGIALGFRRLAILDLSPTGHQPMISADGRFVIVFNGEIYNYRELRIELEQRGVWFRGASDTEVILACCSVWGPEAAIPRLWGMFAFALWDRQEHTLWLARDRLGKKPMYYAQANSVFLFGSELKALRAHPAFQAEVNRNALAAYLRLGYVPTPHCIYKGARKLPQGSYAVIRLGQSPAIHQYWNVRDVAERGLAQRIELSDAEAVEYLDRLLRDAVARRMIADVPLGALLSGGLDSSAVVALMQAQSPVLISTFTIGFHVSEYNEAEAAKAVARHLGTRHTELYVTPEEAREVVPRLPHLYDEPFADPSQIPTFIVCELARQHVTVSLSGDGGDELFGGYTRYAWAKNIWRGIRWFPLSARRVLADAIRGIPPARWDALYARLEPLLPANLRQSLPGDKLYKLAGVIPSTTQDTLYQRLISLWKTPDDVVIGGRERASLLTDASVRHNIPDFTERMMFLDLATYLPDDILVKVDRASMGVSMETRTPLLDHRVVEWAWQLPPKFRKRSGKSKWLLRQILYRYIPPNLIERPKIGFGAPIDTWLRGPLRDWAETLLDERRLRQEGFFQPELVRRSWTQHLSNHYNDQYRLWAVLMFQAWLEQWST